MNKYIFSVVRGSGELPMGRPRHEWNDLTLAEAVALYGASDAPDAALNLRAESGHSATLVRRVEGVDMLCGDYRQNEFWKCDSIVHIMIVPLLVDALDLRFEFCQDGIQSIIYDRFFYLAGGGRIDDSTVAAYMNLDAPKLQNMDVEPLAKVLVRNMSKQLGHDLYGLCVLQHLGEDYAYRVFGDQIAPCDALGAMYSKIKKEGIL